jgi:hypothetical protein
MTFLGKKLNTTDEYVPYSESKVRQAIATTVDSVDRVIEVLKASPGAVVLGIVGEDMYMFKVSMK